MIWNGKEIKTIGELTDAVAKLETQDEGSAFMDLYRKENPHADDNVGYVAGYLDRDSKHRVFELTGTKHPIFGRGDPTPENALRAGILAGKQAARAGRDEPPPDQL